MKKGLLHYFKVSEIVLWTISVTMIVVSFLLFDRNNYLTLLASIVGVTSLIFNAKGNPFGQVLMIGFSVIYGIISFRNAYYGEMITYLGMSMPMAIVSLISWLKNPYKGNKKEVKVNQINGKEWALMFSLSILVTITFYFILEAFNTANLWISTLSVTTSFLAVYMTFRRTPYFAFFYAFNDIVLIVLWVLVSIHIKEYIPMVVCFAAFLFNDIYGFIAWKRMEKRQKEMPTDEENII